MGNILVTGGSGFIGSHFHNYIPHDKLVNLDLIKPAFNHSAEFILGDIRNKEDVIRAINKKPIQTIISLAAKHHDFGIGHDEYFDTNEEGTKILCGVASETGVKQIAFFSSVAVYGLLNQISTENTIPAPDSPYGASKLAAEKVLQDWAAEDSSRKVTIIRPTVVFGANNKANMFNLIRQIDSGLYFHLSRADNVKSIAYVENLVSATLFLVSKQSPGVSIYNYADEPQLTAKEISDTIAQNLNKRIRLTLPKSIAYLIGVPFDLIIRITGKNLPVSTARIRKLGTKTHHSAQKIFSESFVPKFTTTDGLKKMTDWYKSVQEQ